MFDPHGIGPTTSSFIARNKGRVLQRKLIDPPKPAITDKDLDNYYSILLHNGRVPTFQTQDINVNYPFTITTNRLALEKGSKISVKIPVKYLVLDDGKRTITFNDFTRVEDSRIFKSSGSFKLLIIFDIGSINDEGFYSIKFIFLPVEESSVTVSAGCYYYIYNYEQTTEPTDTEKLILIQSPSGENICVVTTTDLFSDNLIFFPTSIYEFQ